MKPQALPRRFPLQLELAYRVGTMTGRGRTSEMGSRCMIADLIPPLAKGARPTLHVCWPATLDGKPLQLVLQGKQRLLSAIDGHSTLDLPGIIASVRQRLPRFGAGAVPSTPEGMTAIEGPPA